MAYWIKLLAISLFLGCSTTPTDGDTDTGTVDTDDTDDTDDTATTALELCSEENPVGLPFTEGGTSYHIGEISPDFTLPTTEGDWTFSENWTGCDVYVFLTYQDGWEYGDALWASPVSYTHLTLPTIYSV